MAEKKKSRFSLSTNILIGMFLGIACGILFGEDVAFLQVAGNAYIKLLQMTILPCILISMRLLSSRRLIKYRSLFPSPAETGCWQILSTNGSTWSKTAPVSIEVMITGSWGSGRKKKNPAGRPCAMSWDGGSIRMRRGRRIPLLKARSEVQGSEF